MNTLKITVILWCILFSGLLNAKENIFEVPVTFYKSPFVNPADYLETYEGGIEKLDCRKMVELVNLFVASAYYSKKNYGQDYSISPKSKIYKILTGHLPNDVVINTKEKGNVVMLHDIAEQLLINSYKIYSNICHSITND